MTCSDLFEVQVVSGSFGSHCQISSYILWDFLQFSVGYSMLVSSPSAGIV